MSAAPSRIVAGRRDQRGAALFLVLVLLFVMAWFALSAFRISTQQLQIVGNSQAEDQMTAAAQRAIDQTISSAAFRDDPVGVASVPIATDIDGDGKNDFTARLDPIPRCIRIRPIKTVELDILKKADKVCLQSSGTPGEHLTEVPGAVVGAGDSMCANTEWDIAASVPDPAATIDLTVHQGVAVRVEKYSAAEFCK